MTESPTSTTPCARSAGPKLRRWAADFWLGVFFWLCEHATGLMVLLRPPICTAVFWFSPAIRKGTRANARRLLGEGSTRSQQDRLARRTVGSFYLFCCDVGMSRRVTVQQLLDRVESISGKDAYRQAREGHHGLIVVTAHMGSFEVAMATLRSMEEHVHVLFRRDASGRFEAQRAKFAAPGRNGGDVG